MNLCDDTLFPIKQLSLTKYRNHKKVFIISFIKILLAECGSDEPSSKKEETHISSLVGLWMLDGQKATYTFYIREC